MVLDSFNKKLMKQICSRLMLTLKFVFISDFIIQSSTMGNEIGSPLEVPETEAQSAQYVPPYLVSLRESGNETMSLTQYVSETDTESDFDYFIADYVLPYLGAAWVLMSLLCYGYKISEDGTKMTSNEPPPNIPPPTYQETVKLLERGATKKPCLFRQPPLEPLVSNANFSVDTFGVVRAQSWGVNSHHLQ